MAEKLTLEVRSGGRASAGPNGMTAFVRLRPHSADLVVNGEIVKTYSDDPELAEILALAVSPLPLLPKRAT